jgi:hypothetical protein
MTPTPLTKGEEGTGWRDELNPVKNTEAGSLSERRGLHAMVKS